MSFKGVGCNNLNANLLNPLNLSWFKTSWIPACMQPLPGLNSSVNWAFHLYNNIPNPSDVATAVANNPNYQRWWLVGGNEPDLDGTTPKQTKQLAVAQMNMVMQGDPQAKFCLTMGSQYHAFGVPGEVPYIVKVWDRLEPQYRILIRAFHTHCYVQIIVPGDGPDVYNPQVVANFCDVQNTGIMELSGWRKNQFIWLTEIGLVKPQPPATLNSLSIGWMPQVDNAIADKCGRYAYYGFDNIPNYACIYENGLTPLGAAFQSIPV